MGADPKFTLVGGTVSSRTSAQVNVANGNLVVSAKELTASPYDVQLPIVRWMNGLDPAVAAGSLGQGARHQLQRGGGDHGVAEIDRLVAERLAQGVAQGGLADEAEGDQETAEQLVGLLLLQQGDAQLVFADDALSQQDLADQAAWAGRGVHGRRQPDSARRRAAACVVSKAAGCFVAAVIARP